MQQPTHVQPQRGENPQISQIKGRFRKAEPCSGQHGQPAFAATAFKPWGPDAPPPAVGDDGPLQT